MAPETNTTEPLDGVETRVEGILNTVNRADKGEAPSVQAQDGTDDVSDVRNLVRTGAADRDAFSAFRTKLRTGKFGL